MRSHYYTSHYNIWIRGNNSPNVLKFPHASINKYPINPAKNVQVNEFRPPLEQTSTPISPLASYPPPTFTYRIIPLSVYLSLCPVHWSSESSTKTLTRVWDDDGADGWRREPLPFVRFSIVNIGFQVSDHAMMGGIFRRVKSKGSFPRSSRAASNWECLDKILSPGFPHNTTSTSTAIRFVRQWCVKQENLWEHEKCLTVWGRGDHCAVGRYLTGAWNRYDNERRFFNGHESIGLKKRGEWLCVSGESCFANGNLCIMIYQIFDSFLQK